VSERASAERPHQARPVAQVLIGGLERPSRDRIVAEGQGDGGDRATLVVGRRDAGLPRRGHGVLLWEFP
jgi:hypothetical protein